MKASEPETDINPRVPSRQNHEVTDGHNAGGNHIEQQSLREIFTSRKADALEKVGQLLELINDLELDGRLDGDPATYEERPMHALSTARVLCWHLEDIESLNLIVANEI